MRDPVLKTFTLLLFAALLLLPSCRRSSSGHRPFAVGGGRSLVDLGDPQIPAAAGYAGSAVCRDCHPGLFDAWQETFHALSVRTADKVGPTGQGIVGDADGNGRNDFEDGLDLAGDPDFSAFGADAPKLSWVAGDESPAKVTIGAVTYDVWRTVGGNGFWRQRYLTRIGRSSFVLPVQFNEATADWVPYEPDLWYLPDGSPRYADEALLPTQIPPESSFDLHCIGCHSNGLEIELDAADGQYLTGYVELNIGCERCHGPARAHVDSGGDTALVLNPADLLDGTAAGSRAAALVCGQCHISGTGGVPANGADPTHYPWRTGGSTFPPGGTDLASYFTPTSDPADYWRRKDNPLGFAPTPSDPSDDTFLTSRRAEMQYLDYVNGVHSPDDPDHPVCFSCHDPHGTTATHLLRLGVEHDGTTHANSFVETNGFCLACHHGAGDFAAIDDATLDALLPGAAPPAAVVDAVLAHLADKAAMPIDAGDYDPEGEGTGRCTSCHELLLSRSAVSTTDAKGHAVFDLASHTFEPIWPFVSELTDPKITNSCSGCHPLDAGDRAAAIIDEWVTDPDGDGTFHPDTPRNFQNGVANPERDGGVACVSCHTTEGFLRVQVGGASLHDLTGAGDAATRSEIVRNAIRRDVGITCRACHGRQPDGTFADGDNPLRFPKTELCGRCHNNETLQEEDYRDTGELVRHPQREMLAGREGGEVPGETYTSTAHTFIASGDCTLCHYSGDEKSHTFEPTLSTCRGCHVGLASFNRPAFDDYDGDGQKEGIQDEVEGALDVLRAAILAAPTSTGALITWDGSEWLIDGDAENTAALDPTADAALIRAMFNHYWVRADGSRGVHNAAYALQLLQKSAVEVTGSPWPGAVK